MSFLWLQRLTWRRDVARDDERAMTLDILSVHARHAGFVFACLQRLGVRDSVLEDAHQEVFLVVHRKLASFDQRFSLDAWLFGICRRVAAAYRRKAYMIHEVPADPDWDVEDIDADPFAVLEHHEERRKVERILDKLDDEKRVVLIMFEIEGIECERIAAQLGIPVGTVYSRLHGARREFEKAMSREEAREAHGKRGEQ